MPSPIDPLVRCIEVASVLTCRAVCGLDASWCALTHVMGWRCERVIDAALCWWEPEHCKASASRCGLLRVSGAGLAAGIAAKAGAGICNEQNGAPVTGMNLPPDGITGSEVID